MKELEDLTDAERAVLYAFYEVNNKSLKSHKPLEAVKKSKFIRKLRPQYVRKGIKVLRSNGFIAKQPTKDRITYKLTRKGLNAGRKLDAE